MGCIKWFFLAGFGVANLYPISLDHAISSVPASQSSTASARGALASASAILSLPLILGNPADQTGMRTAFMIVPESFWRPSSGTLFWQKHQIRG